MILCARHRVEDGDVIDQIDSSGCSVCSPKHLGDVFERLCLRWILRCRDIEKQHGEGKCVPTFEPYDYFMGTDPVP